VFTLYREIRTFFQRKLTENLPHHLSAHQRWVISFGP